MARYRAAVVILSLLFGSTAAAQTHGGDWSLLGAETLPAGSNTLSGAFGWPDFSLELKHGVNPGFDVGGRLSFIYGVESTTTSKFGLGFAVPLRWTLSHGPNVKFLLHWDPGMRLYTYSSAVFGFAFPIGVVIEIPVSAPVKVGLGADFQATLFVTGHNSPQFFFGPLVGPFIEYHVDPRLSIGLDTRFGAVIDAYSGENGFSGGTHSEFGFRMQAMLGYRL
jgi:hypothetical protein